MNISYSSEKYNRNEPCHCNKQNISYKIIENYRSILDRKQQLISTWKIFDNNGKASFTHGTQYRKGTDALVMQLNHICLINPWYKYINVNKHLLSIVKTNHCSKVFEIILLECSCLNEYELAIIECPCLEQMKTYCSYCQLTLTATEQSKRLLKNAKQQANTSSSLDFSDDKIKINDSFYCQSGPYQNQRTVQIQVESEPVLHSITESTKELVNHSSLASQTFNDDVENSLSESKASSRLHDYGITLSSPNTVESQEDILFNEDTSEQLTNYRNQQTQTKLFAILLPESPLSEMKSAITAARTPMNVTRICQVNTLSYLIKTNESQTDLSQIDCSSSTSFLRTGSQLIEDLSIEKKSFSNKLSTKIQHQTLTDRKYDAQQVIVPIIQFDEELLSIEEQSKESNFTLSTLRCINACDTSRSSFLVDNGTVTRSISSDQRDNKYDSPIPTIDVNIQDQNCSKSLDCSNVHIINANNNCEQLTSDHLSSIVCQPSKLFWLKNKHYRFLSRKRRQDRNKKRVYGFLQRLCRRKKSNVTELVSSKQYSPSFDYHDRFQINTVKHITSSTRRQPSIIDLHLITNSDKTPQYKSVNHTIIARASKNSTAGKQLQALINNDDTLLEELIDSQLTLTCDTNCKSICILIDDHKQSEQYRSSFLHYIYTTLSNTLKKIINKSSIQLTCMNLAFFNNSLCDLINMRRLRLIDTGRKILLQPSCEISLKTSDDITIAINRLSKNMSFAHQILIINFSSHERSSSFFFLQLAPICSIRPTGLFTNLNSTTYSVLNLIRQFNHGQLFDHNIAKRYLLNDCSLNRLLKNYLFSLQQTISVITVKQRETKK